MNGPANDPNIYVFIGFSAVDAVGAFAGQPFACLMRARKIQLL
jgi:hypothetical protein